MKLSQLKAVVAVANCGNFSEAALELQLSQPAISHAIATLETELGIPLFSRGRHGAVLTPAGERIVEYAHQALQSIEMMHQEANLQRGLHGGRVRIASFRSVATHLLPRIIAQFRDRFPDIEITIIERPDYLDIEQYLREGRADLGFTYLPSSPEFDTWEIVQDEYIALLPPGHHINTERVTWADLMSYSIVFLPCLPCGRILHEQLKNIAPPMRTSHEIQEDSTIMSMVIQGLGAAILPYLAAVPIPSEVVVRKLPVTIRRTIGVASLHTALHIPAVFAFLSVVKSFELHSLEKIAPRLSLLSRSPARSLA